MKYSPEIIGEIARRLAGRYVPTDVRNILESLESTDEQKALREDAERSRAREAFLSPDRKEPLPAYGDCFPLSETLPGGDGDAYWATETHYYPRAPRNKRPEDATQIIYFSK